MRIISGTLKGRLINFLKNSNTRPLKDNVRESIFNILQHSKFSNILLNNSHVLDLYSGIGSFGIECISRGAKKVTFIDQDEAATDILKDNLKKLSILNKSEIHVCKIEDAIAKLGKKKYNLFFLDPPFKDHDFFYNLEKIKQKKIFNIDHMVIIHREKKSKDELIEILNILDIKNYGRSQIIFANFK